MHPHTFRHSYAINKAGTWHANGVLTAYDLGLIKSGGNVDMILDSDGKRRRQMAHLLASEQASFINSAVDQRTWALRS